MNSRPPPDSATSPNSERSLHDVLMRLPIESWARLIPQLIPDLDADSVVALSECWTLFGRVDQKLGEPPHKPVWLVLGGRGAGKTRTGAEWVKGMALGQEPYAQAATERIALVGETQGQVRDVMIEGVSGLLAIHTRWERPSWSPSRRRLEWPNGAIAQAFSAEDPEGLRGPQFGAAWSDELGTCCNSGFASATGRARSSPRRRVPCR